MVALASRKRHLKPSSHYRGKVRRKLTNFAYIAGYSIIIKAHTKTHTNYAMQYFRRRHVGVDRPVAQMRQQVNVRT